MKRICKYMEKGAEDYPSAPLLSGVLNGYRARLLNCDPVTEKQRVQDKERKNTLHFQRYSTAGKNPDGSRKDQTGDNAAPEGTSHLCTQKIFSQQQCQRNDKTDNKFQKICPNIFASPFSCIDCKRHMTAITRIQCCLVTRLSPVCTYR